MPKLALIHRVNKNTKEMKKYLKERQDPVPDVEHFTKILLNKVRPLISDLQSASAAEQLQATEALDYMLSEAIANESIQVIDKTKPYEEFKSNTDIRNNIIRNYAQAAITTRAYLLMALDDPLFQQVEKLQINMINPLQQFTKEFKSLYESKGFGTDRQATPKAQQTVTTITTQLFTNLNDYNKQADRLFESLGISFDSDLVQNLMNMLDSSSPSETETHKQMVSLIKEKGIKNPATIRLMIEHAKIGLATQLLLDEGGLTEFLKENIQDYNASSAGHTTLLTLYENAVAAELERIETTHDAYEIDEDDPDIDSALLETMKPKPKPKTVGPDEWQPKTSQMEVLEMTLAEMDAIDSENEDSGDPIEGLIDMEDDDSVSDGDLHSEAGSVYELEEIKTMEDGQEFEVSDKLEEMEQDWIQRLGYFNPTRASFDFNPSEVSVESLKAALLESIQLLELTAAQQAQPPELLEEILSHKFASQHLKFPDSLSPNAMEKIVPFMFYYDVNSPHELRTTIINNYSIAAEELLIELQRPSATAVHNMSRHLGQFDTEALDFILEEDAEWISVTDLADELLTQTKPLIQQQLTKASKEDLDYILSKKMAAEMTPIPTPTPEQPEADETAAQKEGRLATDKERSDLRRVIINNYTQATEVVKSYYTMQQQRSTDALREASLTKLTSAYKHLSRAQNNTTLQRAHATFKSVATKIIAHDKKLNKLLKKLDIEVTPKLLSDLQSVLNNEALAESKQNQAMYERMDKAGIHSEVAQALIMERANTQQLLSGTHIASSIANQPTTLAHQNFAALYDETVGIMILEADQKPNLADKLTSAQAAHSPKDFSPEMKRNAQSAMGFWKEQEAGKKPKPKPQPRRRRSNGPPKRRPPSPPKANKTGSGKHSPG